jgi:chemotaxis protein CheY-P-specific phosphatase CheC
MEIAANFLGKDVEDSEVAKFCEDALKETINVLCGHMLTSIAGEEPIFDLSIPIVTALSSDQYAKLSELPESVCFDVEGKCVVVSFSISDSIPQLLNGN